MAEAEETIQQTRQASAQSQASQEGTAPPTGGVTVLQMLESCFGSIHPEQAAGLDLSRVYGEVRRVLEQGAPDLATPQPAAASG